MGAGADTVRWAVLGTAKIAATSFLPGLREAGGGVATIVAGRDEERTGRFAKENGVPQPVTGYQRALDDPDVDAVYIPLPNALHARWASAALRAGKAVLCEKPLCVDTNETRRLLAVAADAPRPLWEAFVFPFHRQTRRLLELIADGAIGEVREVQSTFHNAVLDPGDIRLSRELAGGALADIGCYPVRLARLVFAAEAQRVRASCVLAEAGVDTEAWGLVDFPGERRLLFSCSIAKVRDTTARLLGTGGELRLTAPFAGTPADTIEMRRPDGSVLIERAAVAGEPFAPALRHIHAALTGAEPPSRLAVDEAYGNAAVLDAIRRSATTGGEAVS